MLFCSASGFLATRQNFIKGAATHVKGFLLVVITKMHIRLNELIEKNDFDLLCEKFSFIAGGWINFCLTTIKRLRGILN